MTTGHDGSLTTIHANGTRHAIRRLEMLVGMAGYDLPAWFIRELIGTAVQIVIHCVRLPGGQRKVMAISEVTGTAGDVINMHDLFVFEQTGVDAENRPKGHFVATGIRPTCLAQLSAAGCDLPASFFERRVLEFDRTDILNPPLRPKRGPA
jgi:pilus assembly protein CpaF